jgi:hypothetical protein
MFVGYRRTLVEFGSQVMTQSMQGIIIALLISLLIGVIVGFYLRQSRINELSKALKHQKKRTEEIEQEHEKRLQEATLQLQKDYEQQLADKIELYQTQYDQQVSQLESEYDARLNMMGPAMAGAYPEVLGASAVAPGTEADAVAIEQRIRKQYETRLKEAAQKIQQAYEQHLKAKLNESREALQKDYENRLAEKIEHYQDQLDAQLAQMTPLPPMAMGAVAPYPGPEPMATEAVPSTAAAFTQRDELEEQLRREYEQKLAEKIEHYQDDMAKRLEELEQEYEARFRMVQAVPSETTVPAESAPAEENENQLREQLEERFRTEYEQRLAAAIERYQDDMVRRTQDLEQEYEARLQLIQQQMAAAPLPPEPEPGAPTVDSSRKEGSNFLGGTFTDSPEEGALEASQEDMDLLGTASTDTAGVEEADGGGGNEVAVGSESSAPMPSAGPDESPMDLSISEPAQPPTVEAPQEDALDLDELLTMEQGDELVAEQASADDGSFDLDNLEDLLKEQENYDDSDDILNNLDDLSNLS